MSRCQKTDDAHNLSAVLAALPAAVYQFEQTVDGHERFVFLSEACGDLLGLSADGFLRQPMNLLAILSHDDATGLRQRMDRSAESLTPLVHQFQVGAAEGRHKRLLSMLRPARRPDGTIIWNGFLADITEQENMTSLSRQIEQLRSEQDVLRRMIQLQRREWRQIAFEIHDGFVQYAVAAHIFLQSARDRIRRKHGHDLNDLDQAEKAIAQALQEGRRLVSDLRPAVMHEQGLADAIRCLIDDEAGRGLKVKVKRMDYLEGIEPTLGHAVFRIIQEALSNIRRHAHVDTAQLRLARTGSHLRVCLRDRGCGFERSRVPSSRFGLRGIEERANMFHGRVSVRSRPGRGTLLFVEFPLRPEPKVVSE